MIDIHNHILPQIDDGPRTWEEAVALCELFIQEGVTTVVATPHVFDVRYPNPTTDQILESLVRLKKQFDGRLQIVGGAEVRLVPEVTTILERKELFINRQQYLLVELPSMIIPRGIEHLIFSLTSLGARPIIAHPERTQGFLENPERLRELIRMGCYAHLDAPALLNRKSSLRKTALEWIEIGLVHFVASDAHRPDWRPPRLAAAYAEVERECGPSVAQALFVENPQAILQGEDLPFALELNSKKKSLLGWIQRQLRR